MANTYTKEQIGELKDKLDNNSAVSLKCDKALDVFVELITAKH